MKKTLDRVIVSIVLLCSVLTISYLKPSKTISKTSSSTPEEINIQKSPSSTSPHGIAAEIVVERKLERSIPENAQHAPKVAWLIGYPCGGTHATIDMIHDLTGKTTATNYGHLVEESTGITARNKYESEILFQERVNGPFLYTNYLPLPSKNSYIPTLTYCGGHCIRCYPGRYVLHRDEFIKSCVSGTKFSPSKYNEGTNGYGDTTEHHYTSDLVHKAAVMVRDPIDVIQTRFIYYSHVYAAKLDFTQKYDQSRTGFLAYCQESIQTFADEEEKWWPPGLRAKALNIPCYAEVYKYVQWNDLLCESLDYLNLQRKDFYYEDFMNHTSYVNEAKDILDFYNLAHIKSITIDTLPYQVHLNQKLYSPQEIEAVKGFIKEVSSDCTKKVLARYL